MIAAATFFDPDFAGTDTDRDREALVPQHRERVIGVRNAVEDLAIEIALVADQLDHSPAGRISVRVISLHRRVPPRRLEAPA